jgi:hypothetical protein
MLRYLTQPKEASITLIIFNKSFLCIIIKDTKKASVLALAFLKND